MSRQSRINWSSNTLIKLNVGGHAYEEKARTLRKLKDLIDNEINESHPNFDPQTDCVFLSGDGDMFKFVMHYLRRGTVKLPADFKDHELLCEEAESYGLHDLAELVKREIIPKFVFGPGVLKAHHQDDLAKNCLRHSITLAERLMATKQYAYELRNLNKNLNKFSKMLYETEIRYEDFTIYQMEEKRELASFTDETEALGNDVDENEMNEAKAAESKWKAEIASLPHPNLSQLVAKLDQDTPLVWAKRRTGNRSKTIYINQTFIQRIRDAGLKPNSFEWCVIVVAQAFAIIHETGHLSLRWKGILNTPSVLNAPEAGNYLENRFFTFKFSILVVRPYDKGKKTLRERWNSTHEIKGIGVHSDESELVKKVTDEYINQVANRVQDILQRHQSFDDSHFYPILVTKGPHRIQNSTPTKGCDEACSYIVAVDENDEDLLLFDGDTCVRPIRRTCGLNRHY